MRFENKVLLATGGASGLAAATARQFTDEGGQVAVVDRDADRAARGRGQARRRDRVRLRRLGRGRRSPTSSRKVQQHYGSIDAVFNAAGHAEFGPLSEWSFERWTKMLTVHAGGTFLVCREVLPGMVQRGRGSIVNVASVAALVGQSGNAPYGAAKGAILSFTKQLAKEAAPAVRANVIAPGRTRTGMTEPIMVERAGWSRRARSCSGRATCRSASPSRRRSPRRCASCSRTTRASSPGRC